MSVEVGLASHEKSNSRCHQLSRPDIIQRVCLGPGLRPVDEAASVQVPNQHRQTFHPGRGQDWGVERDKRSSHALDAHTTHGAKKGREKKKEVVCSPGPQGYLVDASVGAKRKVKNETEAKTSVEEGRRSSTGTSAGGVHGIEYIVVVRTHGHGGPGHKTTS